MPEPDTPPQASIAAEAEQARDLAAEVAALLGDRCVATAESCTAGRVAGALATVEGAADFLRGGLVAYQIEVKQRLLGVTSSFVLSHRAAEEMARGAAALLDAQVGVATTGLAGGEPQQGIPAGTVFIATHVDGTSRSSRHRFRGDPEEVCASAARQALAELVTALAASQPTRG